MNRFEDELNLIKSPFIKDFTVFVLGKIDDTVWEKPSSSTGKYHPPQSLGFEGLLRHTKAVCTIAKKLCDVYDLNETECDVVFSACILHDCLKYGLPTGSNTDKNHAEIAAKFIEILSRNKPNTQEESEQISAIVQAVKKHYGKWTTYTTLDFPEDFGKIEQVVHLADVVSAIREISFSHLEESIFLA